MTEKLEFFHYHYDFYGLFDQWFKDEAFRVSYNKFGDKVFEYKKDDIFYYRKILSKEETINILDKILLLICKQYVSLTNSPIELIENTLEAVKQILDDKKDNCYKESFASDFWKIFRDYMECLGKAKLYLSSMPKHENMEPELVLTLNSNNQIIHTEAINMDSLEEAKTMLRVLTLEKNNQIGPIPNVEYCYSKDI